MSVHATTSDLTTSVAAFERAQAVIPGGVNSPVRAYGNVGGTPRFLASARGAYVTDVDGNEYVDLVGSWGPALLGHAHPEVVDVGDVRALGRGEEPGRPAYVPEGAHGRVDAAGDDGLRAVEGPATLSAGRRAVRRGDAHRISSASQPASSVAEYVST